MNRRKQRENNLCDFGSKNDISTGSFFSSLEMPTTRTHPSSTETVLQGASRSCRAQGRCMAATGIYFLRPVASGTGRWMRMGRETDRTLCREHFLKAEYFCKYALTSCLRFSRKHEEQLNFCTRSQTRATFAGRHQLWSCVWSTSWMTMDKGVCNCDCVSGI